MNLGRYWRTLRHLKASQWLWRMRYAAERKFPLLTGEGQAKGEPAPAIQPPPGKEKSAALHFCSSAHGSDAENLAAQLSRGEFEHLNLCRTLGYERTAWLLGPCHKDRLWTVTLHYHQWAYRLAELATTGGPQSEQAGRLFEHYLRSWISGCGRTAPGSRELAWNAYAIATRIGWWVRSFWTLGPAWFAARDALRQPFLRSLWQQAGWLERHLEWDLRANHLLRDAVGLVWAGRFFQGREAERWLEKGVRLVLQQAEEQVLPDGGHFERSPMYHLDIMEDLLTVALLVAGSSAAERFWGFWQRMADFAGWMRHPDGKIPLFNDAAFNGAPEPGKIINVCREDLVAEKNAEQAPPLNVAGLVKSIPIGGRHFPDFGLAVWRGEPWTVFFDVGPVGVDYQPGHAHADTLSLECSFAGQRLFVDPGTFAYDHDERRKYDRSTAAHNTVCVDGQDSSEVWHIFRVGRRAKPKNVQVEIDASGMTVSAAHDGYRHLPGQPTPWRQVQVSEKGALRIRDEITGSAAHRVQAGLLLDPTWKAEAAPSGWELAGHGQKLRVTVQSSAALHFRLEPATYHPEFGKELNTHRLVWQYEGTFPVTVETIVE